MLCISPKINLRRINLTYGLPWWLNGKESTCQWRRFDPWVGKILWRKKRQPTPVFLPGKFHGQRSLVGYSPWGRKRVRYDLATKQQQFNLNPIIEDECQQMKLVIKLIIQLHKEWLLNTVLWLCFHNKVYSKVKSVKRNFTQQFYC